MRETAGRFDRRGFLLTATAVTVAGSVGVGRAASAAERAGVAGSDPVGVNGAESTVAGSGRARRLVAGTRTVGGFEVVPLLDAAGPFFLGRQQAFPEATAADWEAARVVDPAAFGPGDSWHLDFRCFVVRGPQAGVTLVDTGVGPADSPAADWAPTPGRLPAELDRAGIDPADVDTVVLTHLHEDHFGWSVGPDGTPMFPNARYVVQRTEVAALPSGDQARAYAVDPLRATGQLDEVDGAVRLVTAGRRRSGWIGVVPTPGHTPGHQSVVVDGGRARVIVTGDVLVHAVQLVNPEVGYAFEADPEAARRTRRWLLRESRGRRTALATAHLNHPWTHLP
ncbi:MBL fold metallo-hydrolase [Plantactinospora sp. GCM10030261]|uniref:MBL fold metallo-hydrolase n=1 Tax=Plantactinospora sp. GCM10030261 TaxID=3273420 RepID=UPI003611D9FD